MTCLIIITLVLQSKVFKKSKNVFNEVNGFYTKLMTKIAG